MFYSITNCQEGLRGISFGNQLIKQVAEDLKREFPHLRRFATLSPIPGFRRWLEQKRVEQPKELAPLAKLDQPDWATWSITPRTPSSASISDGRPPVVMVAATGLSTKTWFPVPIRRLIVLLPVFAVKTYFPTLVIQQGALWPASMTDVNAPFRKSPSWLECASVMTAVPSR